MALIDSAVSVWKMDDDAWVDSVGSNDGTASGATFSATSKVYDNSGSFDGVDDKVTVSDDNTLDVTNITLACWIFPDTKGTNDYVLAKYNSDADSSYGFGIEPTTLKYFVTTSSGIQIFTPSASVSTVDWSHLMITYDGSTLTSYLNNSQVDTHSIAGGDLKNSTADISFAWIAGTNYYDGLMQQLCLFNKALDGTERAQLYNSGNGYDFLAPTAGKLFFFFNDE